MNNPMRNDPPIARAMPHEQRGQRVIHFTFAIKIAPRVTIVESAFAVTADAAAADSTEGFAVRWPERQRH